jgi:DNA-binding transcriptional LysR family regulator
MRKARTRGSKSASDSEQDAEKAAAAAERVNLPTDLLRTFVAIYELGSFTRAAHLFELTQPAVSAQMRRLESLIGTDLIEKNLSGVNLTEAGEEVLRYARRILSINDQIVNYGGPQPQQVIRLGIPNLFASSKLRRILTECRDEKSNTRLQVCCDHSNGLLKSAQSGYLDLVFTLGEEAEMKHALTSWQEPLVWVRAREFKHPQGSAVPLVSSPNVLLPDRMAMDALDRAGQRYEIVFTAFDMNARRAAVAAGLGYIPILRRLVPGDLQVEEAGVLPDLPSITLGIVGREDLDTAELAPLISAFESAVRP